MRARVTTGGRIHVGFCNLSLAHERLYGGLGVTIDRPRTVVTAAPAEGVECDDPDAAGYARRSANWLGVPGAAVTVEASLPRHVGLGSGTQLALATHAAIARAHDRAPAVREAAPALDRGGRSGVGVAAFERGGVLMDGGHPSERFTTDRPEPGNWTVPPVTARHPVPGDWRFVLVRPDIDRGRSGREEDASLRSVVERAEPGIADEISALVVRGLLPAIAADDREAFGRAVAEIGRLNGVWYADEQGGVYRPPIGVIVDALGDSPAVDGVGQSSWGPTVYGVTGEDDAEAAREAAHDALAAAGIDGEVRVVPPRNRGATIEAG